MTKTVIPEDLAALESAVLAAAPEDETAVAALLTSQPGTDIPLDEYGDQIETELISLETWFEQWGALHDMAAGMVQMRTGNACPLGDQARGAGGQMAAQAMYAMMISTPFLADMFLSTKTTIIGQVMVIGMHGFACVQIVKASSQVVAA